MMMKSVFFFFFFKLLLLFTAVDALETSSSVRRRLDRQNQEAWEEPPQQVSRSVRTDNDNDDKGRAPRVPSRPSVRSRPSIPTGGGPSTKVVREESVNIRIRVPTFNPAETIGTGTTTTTPSTTSPVISPIASPVVATAFPTLGARTLPTPTLPPTTFFLVMPPPTAPTVMTVFSCGSQVQSSDVLTQPNGIAHFVYSMKKRMGVSMMKYFFDNLKGNITVFSEGRAMGFTGNILPSALTQELNVTYSGSFTNMDIIVHTEQVEGAEVLGYWIVEMSCY